MKFEVGDMVMHGWCPEYWCEFPTVRGKVGEIVGYIGYAHKKYVGGSHIYEVHFPNYPTSEVVESLLIPIPPEELQDKEEHETTDKSPVETA